MKNLVFRVAYNKMNKYYNKMTEQEVARIETDEILSLLLHTNVVQVKF